MSAINFQLLEPFPNCVYQRSNDGIAPIPVVGTVAAGTENVTATLSRVKVGTVQTLEYAVPIVQTIPVDTNGNFAGTVLLPGGWYSLVVSVGNTSLPAQKVGAGEVFILFGHSFMQGGHDTSHQLPSTDERVITLLDQVGSVENKYGQLLGSVGPFHDRPDFAGQLGDQLVRRLGVPVLLYGCAYGGSNILQNWQLLTGQTRTQLPPGTTNPASRQPFEPLETVMATYVPKTGVRALLVEHGYNDRGTPQAQFEERFRYVFDYVRTTYQKPALPLVLVQEELTAVPHSLYDIETAKGQQHLIQTYANTFKGPDFNTAFWPNYHTTTGQDHLFGVGIDQFATDWSNALNDGFFANSTPYPTASYPDVLPAVLYNAPIAQIKPGDWAILGVAVVVLIGVYFWQKKYLVWAFLLLAAIGLGRVTGKV